MLREVITTERERRIALDYLRSARLPQRVEICDFRDRRTDRQNKFYWPAFVKPLAEWLSERHGEIVPEQKAHELFRKTFLSRPLVNQQTGEVVFDPQGDPVEIIRSTTELDTYEFGQYLDQCGQLLVDLCGMEWPDPSRYQTEQPGYRQGKTV